MDVQASFPYGIRVGRNCRLAHRQHRDSYDTAFCLKIREIGDMSSGDMDWEFPEKHFCNGYICDCSFFFLSYMEEKKWLVTSPKGKALGCMEEDRMCCICGFKEGKEQLFKKRQEAQRIPKINKWISPSSLAKRWCHSSQTLHTAQAVPAQKGQQQPSVPTMVALGMWQDLLRDPDVLQILRESNYLLFLIILCTLSKEEMELLQELTVFWVQNGETQGNRLKYWL